MRPPAKKQKGKDLDRRSSEDARSQAEPSSDSKSDMLSDISDDDDMLCIGCLASLPFTTLEDEDEKIAACVMEELRPFPLLPPHATVDAA